MRSDGGATRRRDLRRRGYRRRHQRRRDRAGRDDARTAWSLVDKGDFAGQTSSRSSKLIHGGLGYLPQGHLRLVYQALREPERLRHLTAPHPVHSIRFLMPYFGGRRPGPAAIAIGLALYDLLAWTPRLERHRRLAAAEVRRLEPEIRGWRYV